MPQSFSILVPHQQLGHLSSAASQEGRYHIHLSHSFLHCDLHLSGLAEQDRASIPLVVEPLEGFLADFRTSVPTLRNLAARYLAL